MIVVPAGAFTMGSPSTEKEVLYRRKATTCGDVCQAVCGVEI